MTIFRISCQTESVGCNLRKSHTYLSSSPLIISDVQSEKKREKSSCKSVNERRLFINKHLKATANDYIECGWGRRGGRSRRRERRISFTHSLGLMRRRQQHDGVKGKKKKREKTDIREIF